MGRRVKTAGINPGDYDRYDLRGLTLGKMQCVQHALRIYSRAPLGNPLADELLATIGTLDEQQTINGK